MEDARGEFESKRSDGVSAEQLAAEAMAADMDPWIVFDARRTPRAEFEAWLESNRPSQVRRYGDGQEGRLPVVGWISVRGPQDDTGEGDVDALQDSWDNLQASGRPITFQTVKELALNHRVLTGKWLTHLDTGFKVDHAWECIARAVVDGKIAVAKVSPREPGDGKHVLCIYNGDFTDEAQVMGLDATIRATGVKCVLSYKPDVYTYLGIYRNNRWKLCPTIYESKFDLECVPRRSHVVNKVTGAVVS